jgi:hypothetical protein
MHEQEDDLDAVAETAAAQLGLSDIDGSEGSGGDEAEG